MDATYNESFVIYEQILEKTPDERSVFSCNITSLVPIENLFLQFLLLVQKSNYAAFEPVIKTGSINMCGFLKNQKGNKILRMIFNGSNDSKNFPKSCPIEPGFYFFHGFKFDEHLLPPHPSKLLVDRIDVTYNESFVIYEQLLEKTPDESTIFSCNVTYVTKIENSFLQFLLFEQKPNGVYESLVKSGPMNMCGFFKNQKGNRIFRMIFSDDKSNRKIKLELKERLSIFIEYINMNIYDEINDRIKWEKKKEKEMKKKKKLENV
ncbi:CLUMA_CG001231, isoform A [Clunio marinus]|uniref:CLUMA_CG001231, isoform A n=1 Tax=Clunio marinus TaxID=568069 RepID=A0A1J1HHE7_9DIPT|nr:CLUMA_CG001231, isoform A [Clunio marinus]